MLVIEELICIEQDGTISFGNCKLEQRVRKSNSGYQGDMYKVKTYSEVTKLECSDMLVYESVSGTVAEHLKVTDEDVGFAVKGSGDTQIITQFENDTDYEVYVDGTAVGGVKTNMGDKLGVNVELGGGILVQVRAVKRA